MTILAVEGWIYCEDHGGHWGDVTATQCPDCSAMLPATVAQLVAGGVFTCPSCGESNILDPTFVRAVPLPPPFERVVKASHDLLSLVAAAGRGTQTLNIATIGSAFGDLSFALALAGRPVQ